MRATIKVTDLSLPQWDWIQSNLQTSYNMPDNAVRVCVRFELNPEMSERHAEMPVRVFIAMMAQLQAAELRATADPLALARQAADQAKWPRLPTADQVRNLTAEEAAELTRQMNTRPTCPHGTPLVRVTPSIFQRADPMHEYADGCQMVGPTDTGAHWYKELATEPDPTVADLPPLPGKWSAPLSTSPDR